MSIFINNLIPTQSEIRDFDQVQIMIKHARNGGLFDEKEIDRHIKESGKEHNQLIQLARFKDDLIFIRDGHHRILSKYLAGLHQIEDSEYEIKDWKYSQYNNSNLKANWVTPFNQKKEVRNNDLEEWKNQVSKWIASEEDVGKKIQENRHCYVLPRGDIWHIRQLKSARIPATK